MTKGLIIMDKAFVDLVYPPEVRTEIDKLADIYVPPLTKDDVDADPSILKDAEVIFSGWGGPKLNEAFLEAAPNLKACFYGAATVKPLVTDTFWESGLTIQLRYKPMRS